LFKVRRTRVKTRKKKPEWVRCARRCRASAEPATRARSALRRARTLPQEASRARASVSVPRATNARRVRGERKGVGRALESLLRPPPPTRAPGSAFCGARARVQLYIGLSRATRANACPQGRAGEGTELFSSFLYVLLGLAHPRTHEAAISCARASRGREREALFRNFP